MSHRQVVVDVARSLGLLDANGNLWRLDSLMVVDLALVLQEKIGFEIPAMEFTPEAFTSIETIDEFVTRLSKRDGSDAP